MWIDSCKKKPEMGERVLCRGKTGGLFIGRYIGDGLVKERSKAKRHFVQWTNEFDTPFDPDEYQPEVGDTVVCLGPQGGYYLANIIQSNGELLWLNHENRKEVKAWGYPPEE